MKKRLSQNDMGQPLYCCKQNQKYYYQAIFSNHMLSKRYYDK